MNIRRLPSHERPRERLMALGPEPLSLAELIAILLGSGTKTKSVLEVSHEVVEKFGTRLADATVEELMEVKGIGKAKAIQLRAALGVATKLRPAFCEKRYVDSQEAYELVRRDLEAQKQEMLIVVLKDVKGCLIGLEKVAIGTLSSILIHPREVFFPAVRHKASSLIIAHNHPSGDPTPSAADLEITRHLIRSSRIMGIDLDDHLIVGANSFISLKQVGAVPSSPR